VKAVTSQALFFQRRARRTSATEPA
jgi:hypothetical protein